MVLDTLTTADRVNLLELYARSVMLLELGRCADWAALFELHAVLECTPATGQPQTFKGHDALVGLARRMIAGDFDLAMGNLDAAFSLRRHLTDVALFGQGSGHALGYAHLSLISADEARPSILGAGVFSDHLTRGSVGCWRFASRTFVANGAHASALATGTRRSA